MSYVRIDTEHLQSVVDQIQSSIEDCNFRGGIALGTLMAVEMHLKEMIDHFVYEDDYTALDKEPSYV